MMKLKTVAIAAGIVCSMAFSTQVLAVGGASGPHVAYPSKGKIGEIVVNPYGIAPLTAVIRNGGYVITDVSVRIVPKKNGQEIKYKVSNSEVLTHGGIPVFGLYPDYMNQVEVTYKRSLGQKTENMKETYKIYGAPIWGPSTAGKMQVSNLFKTRVIKVDPEFSDRLYLINDFGEKNAHGTRVVWNNPVGGALEWNFEPINAIIDTKGEIRWYMFADPIYNLNSIDMGGVMMGFRQNEDGMFTWGYGQRYVKYDIMGREVWNRKLPMGYNDYSHSMDPMQNGNYLLRVASSDKKLANGKNVRTVRDVIIEVDNIGKVVDEWRLWDILDPYRDNVLKVLDQGAVCLNIDATQAGKTLSSEELAKLDESDHFGDIVGSGPGRNWVHVNSVDYDPTDDSIIISSRHQSAIIKIGRDKKVKWIMGSPEGWKKPWADKVLQPVDSTGKPIKCENSKCEGSFDWTWTQHTGFRIDSKSDKNIFYLSVFDNGDARGMEQPALPEMKYSRAVVYKIDQKKMTVEQIWEYGKERGHEWYSPVTSLTEYHPDKNSIVTYSATAGAEYDFKNGAFVTAPNPYLSEFKWGAKEPSVEIQILNNKGYQAMPINLDKAMNN